jgi:hypothetical protein
MATKKQKLLMRRIEVFKNEGAKKDRDSWNWRRMYGSKVMYSAHGFNSRDIARKSANRHVNEIWLGNTRYPEIVSID